MDTVQLPNLKQYCHDKKHKLSIASRRAIVREKEFIAIRRAISREKELF